MSAGVAITPQRRGAVEVPPAVPAASGWDIVDPAALPAPAAGEVQLALHARLARDLRTARHVPLRQLARRAGAIVLRRLYARQPTWPLARARRAARGARARRPLPALALEIIAPGGRASAEESAARIAQGRLRYLGREVEVGAGVDWRDAGASPLWLFQLHYLGSMLDLVIADREDAARDLLADWSASFARRWDPVAWHPYPTSLRLTNLCFAAALARSFDRLGTRVDELAATHAAYLLAHLERDLRGNHLLENAVALVVAGRHLEGSLAARAEAVGRRTLAAEVPAQVLADGGHFERSPMYHAIVLQRLLQVEALLGPDDRLVREVLRPAIAPMAEFLAAVLAPDGDLPVVGDTARGFAAPPCALLALARPAGGAPGAGARGGASGDASPQDLPPPAPAGRRPLRAAARSFSDTGLHVLAGARLWCLLDAGPTCPAALPGHGQADALAIEVWLDGERIVCDAGVHEYSGPWRRWGRSSRAHSTVTVDDRDDAEVYGSFRVGARSTVLATRAGAGSLTATLRTAAGAVVRRTLRVSGLDGQRLEVADEVEAEPGSLVASRLHVAPGVAVRLDRASGRRARLAAPGGAQLAARAEQAIEVEGGIASTRFGEARPSILLVQRVRIAGGRGRARARLVWDLEAATSGARGAGRAAVAASAVGAPAARAGRG